jgi:ABC-2 type transport system ATP-binding protein
MGESAAAEPAPQVSLRVAGLRKRFGDLVAVDGLTLEVHQGEVFGLLGPNGAGKTTSIRMISGLLRPDAGQVFVHGRPAAGNDPELRARFGVSPQSIVIWPRLTCQEQLEFMAEAYGLGRRVARERAMSLLGAMGLSDQARVLGRNLSGGMQRRLSVALGLVHQPEIVVLDEPEAGLDPQSRVLVREYINALARVEHKTVIFTTHNMDEAERVVDRVAIMDRGKLLELDTPGALKRRIGRGDTLELTLAQTLGESERARLAEAFPGAELGPNGLVLRELGIVDRLPAILGRVKELGTSMLKVQLRESTLEDVFIALTGRSLRE